jgi:NADPH-dependent 2,4-dienoyl-CoA reductase/sulfur reductase-like enzyme
VSEQPQAQVQKIVVVGGGLAGAKTVEALREQGFDGSLTLVGAESELPYERPPLSKDYLAGEAEFDDAVVHPQDWYAEHDVDLRLGTEVTGLDRDARQVTLADGTTLDYDALVLATGSQARHLDVAGADPLTLRTRQDADRIRATFGDGKTLAVVGGGWIGLEVAAAARAAGTTVVLLERSELPLLGVLGPEMAQVFADLHREHGVDLRLGVDDVDAVLAEMSPDAVVVGVGVQPRVELAEAAGLETADDGGVAVDAELRTSDPAIWAVGDIASHDHPRLEGRIRVEHWATALNQPAAAAASILGKGEAYDRLPYFYSDQFDLGMEYVGHARPDDTARVVVRGDREGREFVAFWLDAEDHVLAAMNVNVWDVQDDIRPLILERTVVDPDKLADPDTAYDQVGR